MNRELHIVCLDAPSPADYGGAIEMFGKIKALYYEGIKLHLHYFDYKNRNVSALTNYCETIHSYKRKSFTQAFSFKTPFIVSSRMSADLAANLNKDNHPVILEGIHCTGILNLLNTESRKILIRLHNDEAVYYKKLARYENNILKKIFFITESRRLEKYQSGLPKSCLYACLSHKDVGLFTKQYKLPHVRFLPAFTCWREVTGKEGIGNFCLYHGNLSVSENEKAACWLLDKVFTRIKVPFVIAGKQPSKRLSKRAHLCQHTCLVADPSEKEMNDLIQKAHINILPSFNNTGFKIKLLHALYTGRHCVVNPAGVEGSEMEPACHVGKNANAIASIILQLYHQPFGQEEIKLRKKLLCDHYSNERNAQKIIEWIY